MKRKKLVWYGNPYAGGILLFLSIVPIVLAFASIRDGVASHFWTATDGELTYVNAYLEHGKGSGRRGRGAVQYQIETKYTYTWNGEAFSSSTTTVQGDYKSPFRARRDALWASFESNSNVTVFIDPKNPSKSTLLRGLTPNGFMPLFISLFFFVCGVLILFAQYKMKQLESVHPDHSA